MFSEHQQHIGAVLHKLTTAGFTVNAAKCQFCKPEIKFLGHVYLIRPLGRTKTD
jgi:hypothetical protein